MEVRRRRPAQWLAASTGTGGGFPCSDHLFISSVRSIPPMTLLLSCLLYLLWPNRQRISSIVDRFAAIGLAFALLLRYWRPPLSLSCSALMFVHLYCPSNLSAMVGPSLAVHDSFAHLPSRPILVPFRSVTVPSHASELPPLATTRWWDAPWPVLLRSIQKALLLDLLLLSSFIRTHALSLTNIQLTFTVPTLVYYYINILIPSILTP